MSFLNTFVGRMAVLLIAVALVLGAKALMDSGGSHASAAPCGVLASGNRLCGGDLAAYCRSFVGSSLDQGTVEACSSVGVDVVK